MNSIYQRARPVLLLALGGTIGIGVMFAGVGCFLIEAHEMPASVFHLQPEDFYGRFFRA